MQDIVSRCFRLDSTHVESETNSWQDKIRARDIEWQKNRSNTGQINIYGHIKFERDRFWGGTPKASIAFTESFTTFFGNANSILTNRMQPPIFDGKSQAFSGASCVGFHGPRRRTRDGLLHGPRTGLADLGINGAVVPWHVASVATGRCTGFCRTRMAWSDANGFSIKQ